MSEMTEVEKVARAIRKSSRKYNIQGTERAAGPPSSPWLLIDVSRAEPEVNWPGDLLGEFEMLEEANTAYFNLMARAAIAAMGESD